MTFRMNKDKRMIYTVAGIFMVIFAILIGYLAYFSTFKRQSMSAHSQNTRMNTLDNEVIRGKIYDTTATDDYILAYTDENEKRVYPFGSLYAHAVGYIYNGKTGIESMGNSELLYPNYGLLSIIKHAIFNSKFTGRNIVTTLDHEYQQRIANAMGDKKGAAIVIETKTGKVRAMYSSPTFNPEKIVTNWNYLSTDEVNSPLLNRATKGLYPPGSTFKVVTTLAALQQNKGLDLVYTCPGTFHGDEFDIKCFNSNVHGEIDLTQAFAKSCNGYFVALEEVLGVNALREAAESVGFNKELRMTIGHAISRFDLQKKDSEFEKAATAIGQGRTLITPLHMAMIASSIINDGVCMRPYLIEYAMKQNRQVKDEQHPQKEGVFMTVSQAKELQTLMEGVLDFGTAITLPEKGLVVGGKTGTAQNETNKDHSWFMGYAYDPNRPDKAPIAFSVIVEGGGVGAQSLKVSNVILEAYRSK